MVKGTEQTIKKQCGKQKKEAVCVLGNQVNPWLVITLKKKANGIKNVCF